MRTASLPTPFHESPARTLDSAHRENNTCQPGVQGRYVVPMLLALCAHLALFLWPHDRLSLDSDLQKGTNGADKHEVSPLHVQLTSASSENWEDAQSSSLESDDIGSDDPTTFPYLTDTALPQTEPALQPASNPWPLIDSRSTGSLLDDGIPGLQELSRQLRNQPLHGSTAKQGRHTRLRNRGPGSGAHGALLAPAPTYPLQARLEHRSGVVLLDVLVGPRGRTEAVQIASSSGHPDLDASARETVLKSWFFPKQMAGTRRLRIEFDLSSAEGAETLP